MNALENPERADMKSSEDCPRCDSPVCIDTGCCDECEYRP